MCCPPSGRETGQDLVPSEDRGFGGRQSLVAAAASLCRTNVLMAKRVMKSRSKECFQKHAFTDVPVAVSYTFKSPLQAQLSKPSHWHS